MPSPLSAAILAGPIQTLFPRIASPRRYSRFMRAMFVIGISFGQTASHSPSFEQLPNPSASWRSTIATARRSVLDLPLRQQREMGDLGRREQRGRGVLAGGDARPAADARGRVHRLLDDGLRNQDGVAVLRAADVNRGVAAGLDDPVERASVDDEVLDRAGTPARATAPARACRRRGISACAAGTPSCPDLVRAARR